MESVAYIRDDVRPEGIRGLLIAKGEEFQILERPWLNNRNNVSCIPAGLYKASFLAASGSGKYKNIYHLQDVPGRGGILIHNGNLVKHSRGCLIIGKRRGTIGGQIAVLNSRTALFEFVELMEHKDFYLNIMGDQVWQK